MTGSARTCLVGINVSQLMDQCQWNFLWTAVSPRVPAWAHCCSFTPLSFLRIIKRHLSQVHCYDDDIQLYLSFWPGDDDAQDVTHRAMEACIEDIRKWMIDGRLLLNKTKTEFLAIGTRQQLSKLRSSCIQVGNQKIFRSSSVRNLGVMLD